MLVEVTDKVLDFMKKKNYVGIIVDKEIQACGWAGPRESIRGEFVKTMEDIEDELGNYNVKEVSGIKVFIPKHLDDRSAPHIRVSSLFNFFGLMMPLNVEM